MITVFDLLYNLLIVDKIKWYQLDHLIVGLVIMSVLVGIYVLGDYLISKLRNSLKNNKNNNDSIVK